MNKYESVIIMKPDVDKGTREKIVTAVEEIIESYLETEDMGIRKLAYTIKGNEEGYYLIFNFKCEADKIDELERYYRIDDNIIKFITVKTDDEGE